MKRRALIRHLEKHGCVKGREGANHTIYLGPSGEDSQAAVPRHNEIAWWTVTEICKELNIPKPSGGK
jgi:mRNA interferase HicA